MVHQPPYGGPPQPSPPPGGYPQQGGHPQQQAGYPQQQAGYPQQQAGYAQAYAGQGGPLPQPGQPGGPPKKKSSGCLVAVLVVVVLGTLSLIGAGIFVYSQVGGILGGVGDLAGIMLRAGKAPGTQAMRDTGCDESFIIDVQELSKATQKFEDEIAKREGRDPKEIDLEQMADHYALCKVRMGKTPSCKAIAEGIVDEVDLEGKLLVTVQGGASTNACTERFDASTGKSLGEAKAIPLPSTE